MIETRSIERLEFEKILQMVLDTMPSHGAKTYLLDRGFIKDEEELRIRSEKNQAAIDLALQYEPIPSGVVYEIEEDVERARKGSSLDEETLIHIMDSLRSHRRLREFFDSIEGFENRFSRLTDVTSPIGSFKVLEKEIDRCIDDELRVRSSASPELSRIRTAIERTEEELKRKLNSFITDSTYQDYLQENIITLRDDRYVIPVKAEHKRRIPGMVLDSSSSGSTVYVEPVVLMEINNKLRELRNEELEEVKKILRDLSQRVGNLSAEILPSQLAVTRFFVLLGTARFALKHRAHVPKLSKDQSIVLKNARHPLIDPQKVVAMSMDFGRENRVLIITGPNTGGKTVSIKTLGLLVLMNQYGIPIYADDSSELPFFEKVFVDIGDEQSIEQSLSTFSSHMKNIVHILDEVDEKSLVLLDELGAGTDPSEGSALARSILEKLKERGALVFATSHYSEIKQFAMTHDGYMNASMEFDIKTLSPTYRLMMGIPGSSNAFAISKKLGLQDSILEHAKTYMGVQDIEMEGLLRDLEQKRVENDEMARDIKANLKEVVALRERYEERLRRISEQRERILDIAKEEARKFMRETEQEAKEIMKDLRSMSEGTVDFSKMERQQKRINERKKELVSEEKIYKPKAPKSLKLGDNIYVPKLQTKGTVDSEVDKDGNFRAQIGILKMTLNIKEVEKVQEEKETWIPKVKGDIEVRSVETKLDLRGKNVEEARLEVDHFLDQALLGRASTVEIIHGKGTGVLRNFIKDYLKKHPHVKTQRFGSFHEGGDGVTIVELK
ncbi:endonuclease MutS2 [Guggenheimella bovis]